MLIKWKFKKIGKSKFSDRVLREFLGCVARRGATSHQGAQGMGVGEQSLETRYFSGGRLTFERLGAIPSDKVARRSLVPRDAK